MKNILKYSVAALFGLGIVACTGDFEKMNTSDVQVNPDDLPLSSQCAEPMQYCYPPQQNMFQFWTNLTVDFYSGYFMTPNGNFTNGDMGENRGHSGGMYENHYLHVFNNTRRLIATLDGKNQPALAGVMRIVQAYSLMMTTDVYGPLAHSSILSGEYESYFPFDSQQQLYQTMLDDTQKALDAFNKPTDDEKAGLGTFDIWCGGDFEMWKKVANTMRLRIALRLSKRADEMKAAGYDLPAIANAAGETDRALARLAAMAREAGAAVVETDRRKLDQLSATGAHQGVIAMVAAHAYATVEEILENAKNRGEAPLIVICDELSDPHNLGAIIRTAECAGAHGVIIPKRRSVGLTAVVGKASAGALEYLPVARVANLVSAIRELQKAGVWVFGTAADGDTALYQADLKGPAAIVIGNEGDGMSRLVAEACDFKVSIPMRGRISSLNASNAAAILLYEAVRQRG